jgi:uncharacterized LabA/DUF88 family protein
MGTDLKNKQRITLLIDAENISYNHIDTVISKLEKLGTVKLKIAYANWSKDNLGNWEKIIIKHSIQTIQQFNYVGGKNATDIRLVIDAMKILNQKDTDAFCIFARDSDYTALLQEIRASDLIVYGFGDSKTPEAFVNSCNDFFPFEQLTDNTKEKTKSVVKETKTIKQDTETKKINNTPIITKQKLKILKNAVKSTIGKDGWSSLSSIGQELSKNELWNNGKKSGTLKKLFEGINKFIIIKKNTQYYIKLNK